MTQTFPPIEPHDNGMLDIGDGQRFRLWTGSGDEVYGLVEDSKRSVGMGYGAISKRGPIKPRAEPLIRAELRWPDAKREVV